MPSKRNVRKFSIPILGWVAIGLLIVAALPFALSWYQISSSRDSLVDQSQLTHLVVARANADGLNDYLSLLDGMLVSAGDDADLYLDPSSEAAAEVLRTMLESRAEIASVGLFAREDESDQQIYQMRRPGEPLFSPDRLERELTLQPRFINVGDDRYLSLQRESARPKVFLGMLVRPDLVVSRSAPPELGNAAQLAIIDRRGNLLAGDSTAVDLIPEQLLEQTRTAPIRSDARRFETVAGTAVAAFARVPIVDWVVLSVQPSEQAEMAATRMRNTAWKAFAVLALIILGLLFGAHRLVVSPIRSLIAAQRRLTGGVQSGGSEIEQLKLSFEKLEGALDERDSLSEIFLDRYQVLHRIGSGAMGTVYLGWDPKLRRKVALKTVKFDDSLGTAERRELTTALLTEGITSAGLTHPNIVTTYDVLGDDDHAFIAMEYVDGEGLDARLKREVRMAPRAVAETAQGILRGLRAAHNQGVIHRDIKPANVMIAADGSVKVSDFGIAGLMNRSSGSDRVVMGTPGYIAPETCMTGDFGIRTDLFAVGVVMMECLTGKSVFFGRNTAQVLTRTASKDVHLPPAIARHAPAAMVQLIDDLLQKDPNRRPADADEALERFAAFAADLQDAPLDAAELPQHTPEDEDGMEQGTSRIDIPATRRID